MVSRFIENPQNAQGDENDGQKERVYLYSEYISLRFNSKGSYLLRTRKDKERRTDKR